MTELTPEIISRGRGADPQEAARRRRAAWELRAVREKLTSTTGLARAFDYEILRTFAETRRNAATTMFLMVLVMAGASSVWIHTASVLVWLTVTTTSLSLMLLLCHRFLVVAPSGSLRTWRRSFVLAEIVEGLSWALLLHWLLLSDSPSVRTFVLFVGLLVTAVHAMLAYNVPVAVYVGIVPMTLVVAAHLLPGNEIEWLTMCLMAGGGQFYFVVLANRLYSTTLATLDFRAEKDALIAELEQAKANSDEARRRAEEANIAKSHFLATMSHELRTPLNAILGFSEVMKSELFGQHAVPAYREYSNDIHSSGQLLLDIINEILDLSRIEAGRYELKEEAVSLAYVVEDCRHMLQMRARNRNITIHEALEHNLPRLWADERSIRQIALNLLSNAIKFSPQGAEVTLKVGWTAAGGQYLSIRDNGPGIPEDEIPIVLQSFGRGSLAIKTAEQGTGLGLPIVKGLVEMHGGSLIIRSKPREGTEVIATFPPQRVMDTLAPLANESGPAMPQPTLRRRRAAA